jgi:hypothetical protein
MTSTELNTAPEVVRKYLLGLLGRDETVIKLDGRPVARMTPLPDWDDVDEGGWTPEKNRRRCILVDLEIDGRITPDEERELRALEREFDLYLDEVAPLPLDELRKRRDELAASVPSNRAAGS